MSAISKGKEARKRGCDSATIEDSSGLLGPQPHTHRRRIVVICFSGAILTRSQRVRGTFAGV